MPSFLQIETHGNWNTMMLTSRSNPLLLQWPWSRRNRPLESILWNHANDRPYTITTVHISLMVWTRGCVISQISYVVFTNVFIRHDFTMTSCGSSYVNSKVLKQISWDSMNSYYKVCHNIFAFILHFCNNWQKPNISTTLSRLQSWRWCLLIF